MITLTVYHEIQGGSGVFNTYHIDPKRVDGISHYISETSVMAWIYLNGQLIDINATADHKNKEQMKELEKVKEQLKQLIMIIENRE